MNLIEHIPIWSNYVKIKFRIKNIVILTFQYGFDYYSILA